MMGGAAHGYRRRRGQVLEECYVIDKSHPQCQNNDQWDASECKKASEEEYQENKACYDCQDDECIKNLCEEIVGECNPNDETCACGGWEQQNVEAADKCSPVDGACPDEAFKSCCECYAKMQSNLKCDGDEEDETEKIILIVWLFCLVEL